jgi:threonine/homoserine/homoserine lactone efflux protein
VSSSNLLLFVGMSLLLIIAPGPDLIFLLSQGLSRGKRAGLQAALGLAAGNLVHTLAAALGVSVIFRTSALAFQGLKAAGVIYLLYLAYKTVRRQDALTALQDKAADGGRSLFWRAFTMNVLNPKVALFFLAFLPQFAAPGAGPIWLQMLLLGAVFIVLVALVFGPIGLCAGLVSGWMKARGARAGEFFRWLTAGVFAALAVRLAFVRR